MIWYVVQSFMSVNEIYDTEMHESVSIYQVDDMLYCSLVFLTIFGQMILMMIWYLLKVYYVLDFQITMLFPMSLSLWYI